MAKIAAGDAARGVDVQARKKDQREEFERSRQRTLEVFLTEQYEPWANAHLKSAKPLREALRADFKAWMGKPMTDINRWLVEGWRKAKLGQGRTAVTVNRAVQRIHGALSKAVEWGVIEHHPFTGLKPLKTDKRGRVRFLSAEDEERLRAALIERETQLRSQRDRFNHWRAVRHKTTFPVRDQYFVDYIRPIVLLAMNTGMRRAEILGLRWADVDLNARLLTVTGTVSKNRQSRHIPLNVEAKDVLTRWKAQRVPSRSDEVVFGGHKGEKMLRIDKAWAGLREVADLPGWRLHDLRHHFASRLVQEGTDLNVVRELLGHADITMVLRYAHLDPTNLAVAVERVARTAVPAGRAVRA